MGAVLLTPAQRPGGFGYSDAAKRVCDAIQTHLAALGSGAYFRWVAVRLADGTSDGVLYDTRADAISHQLHESLCAYYQIPPTGISPREAEAMLRYSRFAYDNGYRLPDPETPEPIMPLRREEIARLTGGIRYGR